MEDRINTLCNTEIQKLNEELNKNEILLKELDEKVITGQKKITELKESIKTEKDKMKRNFSSGASLRNLESKLIQLNSLYKPDIGKITCKRDDVKKNIEAIIKKIKYCSDQIGYLKIACDYVKKIYDESKNDSETAEFYSNLLFKIYNRYIYTHINEKYDSDKCPIDYILSEEVMQKNEKQDILNKVSIYNLFIGYAHMIHFFIKLNEIVDSINIETKDYITKNDIYTFPINVFDNFNCELPDEETVQSNSGIVPLIIKKYKWLRDYSGYGFSKIYRYELSYIIINNPFYYSTFNLNTESLDIEYYFIDTTEYIDNIYSIVCNDNSIDINYDNVITEYDMINEFECDSDDE